jgi:hypothetical protein
MKPGKLLIVFFAKACAVRSGCGGSTGGNSWKHFDWLRGPAGAGAICWN